MSRATAHKPSNPPLTIVERCYSEQAKFCRPFTLTALQRPKDVTVFPSVILKRCHGLRICSYPAQRCNPIRELCKMSRQQGAVATSVCPAYLAKMSRP